ncbi:Transcription termination factor 1 [Anas platyrhynchos]|uniref:Transcription termination factor 1 n=1 Tax=Anas platyrhynchos TaxID=8839 RepID=R0K820_ANAPL|nr:Transcription termination factor 1 [Anas platyrhynchos]
MLSVFAMSEALPGCSPPALLQLRGLCCCLKPWISWAEQGHTVGTEEVVGTCAISVFLGRGNDFAFCQSHLQTVHLHGFCQLVSRPCAKGDEDDRGGSTQGEGWDVLANPLGSCLQNAESAGLPWRKKGSRPAAGSTKRRRGRGLEGIFKAEYSCDAHLFDEEGIVSVRSLRTICCVEKQVRKNMIEEASAEDFQVREHLKKKKKKRKERDTRQEDDEKETIQDAELFEDEAAQGKQNRQEEDTVLPSPRGEGGVAVSKPCHEDGDSDASPAACEASVNAPANSSKPTGKTNQSSTRTPARPVKIKSKAYITDESSSDSDTTTPKPKVSKKARSSTCTETVTSGDVSLDGDESLDSVSFSLFDLDAAKQELEEFIPHVRQISEDSIRKMAGRDLMRFKEFKKQGIPIKFGRFSQKENEQIRKNIEEFMALTGIDSAEKLLFTSRYPEEKHTINRLKARHLFCEKLAEGIPRAWRLIYYRARKMFDSNNYKGRYTKEEKEKLKKYHALHGNDWKKISEMMSRSNLSVAMKYSEIKSPINYGPWSKEETQKLMRAVEEVFLKGMESEDAKSVSSSEKSRRNFLIEREKLLQKLPWNEIEAKVGTRYWRQCKQKWLYEMKVEDADEVNWEELSDIVGGVPKDYVRARFYKLKVSYVPLWQKKTFSEIIDYLFEEKLPEFEEKLESRKGKQLSSADSTDNQQKKVFRFSDVFDSSEESDDSLKNN